MAGEGTILIFSIPHFYILVATIFGAAISYISKNKNIKILPNHDPWIVPWMILWWSWELILLLFGNSPYKSIILMSLVPRIIAPIPVILLFANNIKKVRSFAIAYMLISILSGLKIYFLNYGISLSTFLSDPTLRSYGIFFYSGKNYHWFSYPYAISLILIVVLLIENKSKYIRLIFMFGILLFFFLIIITNGSAITITVNDDGDADFSKIQDAINKSEDWDIIRVFEGKYNENIIVNRSISLIGNGSKVTIIDGGKNGDVVRISADWVNIRGFTVTGSGFLWGSVHKGITIESNHCIISNNNCSNNYYGIYFSSIKNCTIKNNTCETNDFGIYFMDSTSTTIVNNTCQFNEVYGILMSRTTDSKIASNNCTDNYAGVFISRSNNCSIKFNNCTNNYAGIWLWYSNKITLENNTSVLNEDGFSLRESNDCTIMNNTCSKNKFGVYVFNSEHNHFSNNYLFDNEIANFEENGDNEDTNNEEPDRIILYLLIMILVGLFVALIIAVDTYGLHFRKSANNRPL